MAIILGTAAGSGETMLDQMIWAYVHSSPNAMMWYAVVALMLKGVLFGVVLVNAARYFTFFHSVDHVFVKLGIGLGTAISTAQIGLNAHQVRELLFHASSTYASIARNDANETLAVTFITAHFNAAATTFYAWRAWKLSGRKKTMVVHLVLGIIASYALSIPVLAYGVQMPEISIANSISLQDWLLTQAKLIKAWGCTSVGVDICLCVRLVYLFLRSKESMFHEERALLNKLLILVFETMIPPTIAMLILVCWTSTTGNQLTDFWRVLVWVLPDLYFLSILHSLNSRRTIRTMLDARQISDGVVLVTGQPASSTLLSARPRAAEEGRGTFGAVSQADTIKVEIDTFVSETRVTPEPSPLPITPSRHASSPQPGGQTDRTKHRSSEPSFVNWPKIQDTPAQTSSAVSPANTPISSPSSSPSSSSALGSSEKRSSRRKPVPPFDPFYWPHPSQSR